MTDLERGWWDRVHYYSSLYDIETSQGYRTPAQKFQLQAKSTAIRLVELRFMDRDTAEYFSSSIIPRIPSSRPFNGGALALAFTCYDPVQKKMLLCGKEEEETSRRRSWEGLTTLLQNPSRGLQEIMDEYGITPGSLYRYFVYLQDLLAPLYYRCATDRPGCNLTEEGKKERVGGYRYTRDQCQDPDFPHCKKTVLPMILKGVSHSPKCLSLPGSMSEDNEWFFYYDTTPRFGDMCTIEADSHQSEESLFLGTNKEIRPSLDTTPSFWIVEEPGEASFTGWILPTTTEIFLRSATTGRYLVRKDQKILLSEIPSPLAVIPQKIQLLLTVQGLSRCGSGDEVCIDPSVRGQNWECFFDETPPKWNEPCMLKVEKEPIYLSIRDGVENGSLLCLHSRRIGLWKWVETGRLSSTSNLRSSKAFLYSIDKKMYVDSQQGRVVFSEKPGYAFTLTIR